MSNRPLALHLPEGTRERHFDSRVRIVVVLAAPGVVLDVPCGFHRYGAVGARRRNAGRLVQPGLQRAFGRLDVQPGSVDDEDGVTVAQQRERGVGFQRYTVREAGLARAEAEMPGVGLRLEKIGRASCRERV